MKTEITDISPTLKNIKIEIDAAAVRREFDRVSEHYAKHANIPGFRKGHAPSSIVKRHYKKEIRGEVLRELVPQALADIIQEKSLRVLSEPELHIENPEELENFGEKPISLNASLEVFPEINIGEYKGIEITRRTRPITDEDISRVIEDLREESASLQPVEDRAAQLGDTVTVTFNGKFLKDPEAEDINVEDVEVVLGGQNVLQSITDALVGTRPDDERTFIVNYPEDFQAKGLAGKDVEYRAKVSAVRVKELPELDDSWAKSVGESIDSLQALRGKVKSHLEETAKAESNRQVRDEIVSKLVNSNPIEVPKTLLEDRKQSLLQSYVYNLMQQGIDPNTVEIDRDSLMQRVDEEAQKELRGTMLLDRIADSENISVDESEIDSEIEQIAASLRKSPEEVRSALTKQGRERSIADRLIVRKTLDFLVESAKIVDGEWIEESPVDSGQDKGESPKAANESSS
jgi:trigger factor